MKLITLTTILLTFSAFAARPIRGTYEVPVNDELKPHASYPVRFKSEDYDRNFKKITFPLPATLTGLQNMITIYQSSTDVRLWTGDQAVADCGKIDRYFVCNLRFKNLQTDLHILQDLILRNFPQQAEAKMKVAEMFLFGNADTQNFVRDHEPAGILRYKLRGGERE